MKNKNRITTLFALCILLIAPTLLSAIEVNPTSGPYIIGQTISFRGSSPQWDDPWVGPRISFGDGATDDTITYSHWVSHVYRHAGTYTVSLIDLDPYGYGGNTPEYLTITITDVRRIRYTPANPLIGQTITFTAENFVTPKNIRWDFGDGVIVNQHEERLPDRAGHQVTHSYTRAGSYTVRVYDWNGTDTVPVTLNITIGEPAREIQASISSPREDQPVTLTAVNFMSKSIDWDFGDGEKAVASGAVQQHRYMRAGQVTVSALDRDYTQTPTTLTMLILPENRSITASPTTVIFNQPVTLTALQFRGDGVLWNFGDGTQIIGSHQEVHNYTRPGRYTVSARDESGQSQRTFSVDLTVQGITDEVSLHTAELRFDNGRAYRVVARNSSHLQAELQMKMEGTGLVTGIWLLDGQPFKQFSQLVNQGVVTTIKTGFTPPLPTIDPGLHKLTVQLFRPTSEILQEISYFVEPVSALLEVLEPRDGMTFREDEVPSFKWAPVRGASWYELGFSDSLFLFLYHPEKIQWQTVREFNEYIPDGTVWSGLTRNRPVFWQVRAVDGARQLISQSEPREFQLSLNPAVITIRSVSDLLGKPLTLPTSDLPRQLLLQGSVRFPGDTKFLLLRVFADDRMVNQLLLREVKPDKEIPFSSSCPGKGTRRITLQILKPVTPAVVVGVHQIELNR